MFLSKCSIINECRHRRKPTASIACTTTHMLTELVYVRLAIWVSDNLQTSIKHFQIVKCEVSSIKNVNNIKLSGAYQYKTTIAAIFKMDVSLAQFTVPGLYIIQMLPLLFWRIPKFSLILVCVYIMSKFFTKILISCFFVTDFSDRLCETFNSEEGDQWKIPREIPSHSTDLDQAQKVREKKMMKNCVKKKMYTLCMYFCKW